MYNDQKPHRGGYETPDFQIFTLAIEGIFCQSSSPNGIDGSGYDYFGEY